MKNYPPDYIDYLVHFHGSRDYFECHEIMEEFWLENGKQVKWLSLIQLAVAVYHERQKNYSGSLRLYRKVLAQLESNYNLLDHLDVNSQDLQKMIEFRINNILDGGSYQPMNLPLTNETLVNLCMKKTKEKGWIWQSTESANNTDLIYRHKRRDRNDVIEARKDSLLRKKQEREKK